MSYLSNKAEQALLGAVLAGQNSPDGQFWQLVPQDFGNRAHREVFAAVFDLYQDEPWLNGNHLLAAVAARVGEGPGAEVSRLQQWRERAARPDHIASYAKLIQTAAFRREIAAHADYLLAAAKTPGAAPMSVYQQEFTDALVRQVEAYAELTTAATSVAGSGSSQSLPQQEGQIVVEVAEGPSDRVFLEEQILADLIRNPEQSDDLATFLPDDSFTSSQRRETYRAILNLADGGEPIDEIIIEWQMGTLRASERLYGRDVDAITLTDAIPESTPEPDAVFLDRLATTTVTIASAIEAGRDLLVSDIHVTLEAHRTAVTVNHEQAGPSPTPGSQASPTPGLGRDIGPQVNPGPVDPQLTPPPSPEPGSGQQIRF